MQGKQDSTLLEIFRYQEVAKSLVRASFPQVGELFESVSIHILALEPPELGFLKMVSWLYVHYFEAGRKSIPFVVNKAAGYGIDPNGDIKTHMKLVNSLRTYLQHNLSYDSSRDNLLVSECENWFLANCATRIPAYSEHWDEALQALCNEAVVFFRCIADCLREMEHDASHTLLEQQWQQYRDRQHAPHEFDSIVSTAAKDMGRDTLDSVAFRKKHYETWTKALSMLNWPYEFKQEARRLIEQSILDMFARTLPITGEDVIMTLGIAPGPKVGEILSDLRRLCEERQYSVNELLEIIRRDFVEAPPK